MGNCKIVYVTVPDIETGRNIADKILEQRLGACVNIIPAVESVYLWRGNVEYSSELLMMIKTTADLIEELKKTVLTLHPYDVAEFISLDISDGSTPYLNWIKDSVKDK